MKSECFLTLIQQCNWHVQSPENDISYVTINREPVENWFKRVMIQIGWDAKQIVILLGVRVYMNVCLKGTYCL